MKMVRLKTAVLFGFLVSVAFVQMAQAQNFSFTVEPGSLTLVPGQSASFVVSLTPLDGFTNQVTLSASNLPSGVTALFSPQSLTPPGTSVLTLNATTNAANGAFTLDLSAAGGGITNTTSSSVSVQFGLLPVCYGAFEGTVTDTTTGLPVPYAVVTAQYSYYYTTTADANGHFLITNLALGSSENLPLDYYITATRSNYWSSYTYSYAVCDATNTVNLQILAQQFGTITGSLTARGGQPLTNTIVNLSGPSSASVKTDTNGNFQFESVSLNNNNAAAYYTLYSQPTGYWQVSTNTTVQAGSNSVVNLVAIPVCQVTVTGSVVYGDTGLPATNLSLVVVTYDYFYGITDGDGNYTLTNVTLDPNNVSVNATVESSAPGYYETYTNVLLSDCGQIASAPVLRLAPIPVVTNNYGAVTGHVYDLQTGLPITNAYVSDYYTAVYTDTNGAYLITNVLVGTGPTTNQYYNIYGSANNYYQSISNLTIYAGETATQDLYLLRMGYGFVAGTVLDSSTGLPVSNVYVSITGKYTGADGHYASGPLQLNSGNVPTYESFYAQETGYWTIYTNTTITNGITNIVDIDIIKVCTGATIIGNVVNALTEQPITNATVQVPSQYLYAYTDTNGYFIITNVTVGNDNSPIQTTLTASAPGFNSQSKTLTIFCDAVISTEFGAPETAFAAIDGYVTNIITGQPLTNVFIGSGFGEATATDTNGYYILSQAPLGSGGASRTWTVTAAPSNYPPQTESILVSSNVISRLDFSFGEPPTDLSVSASNTPLSDVVGSNLVYSITLSNSVADALNVSLTDTLPPGVIFVDAIITNNPGGEFTGPVQTNNQVIITAADFSSNSTVMLLITVIPTVPGILTNTVVAATTTPNLNPADTNLTATLTTPVTEPASNTADIGVGMTGLPNPVELTNLLTYTISVTNFGPSDVPNVALTDSLPANITISNVTISQGFYSIIGNSLQWQLELLTNQGTASATIVVLPLATGTIINTATVTITDSPIVPTVVPAAARPSISPPLPVDPNSTNNTVSVTNLVFAPGLDFGWNTPVLNPQTGLFEQTVWVTNLTGSALTSVQVSVLDLATNVQLYNKTGTNSTGAPYVEYDQSVPNGNVVVFMLEYYDLLRTLESSTNFEVSIVTPQSVPLPIGTVLQLDRPPFTNEGRLTIEFTSVSNGVYVVEYSSSPSGPWLAATPPIVAINNRTQWVDGGPPVTESVPVLGQRFYQIIQTK